MSFLSGLFEPSGQKKPKLLEPAWQGEEREKLTGLAMPGAAQALQLAGEPPPIQKTAPMSDVQQTAYGGLQDYMTSPLASESSLYQAGTGEIEKTLADDYDPVGSTYYQAYRSAVMRELQEAKDRLAASTSARDKYFGGGRIAAEGELEESAVGDLAMVLGQLQEKERERKLGVAPMAIEEAIRETDLPAERARTGMELGDLPRQLEELGYSREHAAYLQELTNLGIPLQTAIQLVTYKPDYFTQETGASPFSQVAGPTADIGSALILASALSDERMKENIAPIDNALDKVGKLDGKTYNYSFNKPDNRDAGVIAQDLESVLPEAITEKDGVKYVKLDAIAALLVNAVKELNAKVEALAIN